MQRAQPTALVEKRRREKSSAFLGTPFPEEEAEAQRKLRAAGTAFLYCILLWSIFSTFYSRPLAPPNHTDF